jgi:trimeric autotransporter adhesin
MIRAILFRGLLGLFTVLPLCNSLAAQPSLALSSGSGASGSAVILNLSLSGGASQAAALQWTLTYPSGSVTALSVAAGPALTAAGKTVTCADAGGTDICLATGVDSQVIPDGIAATVSVTLASTASSAAVTTSNTLGATTDGSLISFSSGSGTASIQTVTQSSLSGLSCSPSSLGPGGQTTCTVTLSAAASADTTVTLSADSTVTVPASVSVAAGASTATFTATATAFTADQSANVVASLNGVTRSAALSLVTPPTLSSLQCAVTSIAASASTTCTVTISKAAPSGGATVSLSGAPAAAVTVPASVQVSAGATTATFTATAGAVTTDQTGVVTATLNGSTKTVNLAVAAPAVLTSLQCGSTSLAASAATTCTVTISKTAPGAGTTVTLASSPSTALIVPGSVVVPSGSTTASFQATAGAVTTDQTVSLSATLGGSITVKLSIVAPIVPISLQCTSTTLTSNASTGCTLTISKSAPAAGSVAALSTSAPSSLSVPASVTIPAGSTSATFTVTAKSLTASLSATVGATLGGGTVSATLSLAATPVALSQLTCSPTALSPGKAGSCTVTLTASSASAATVTLKSTSAALVVPASVSIAAGSASATFGFTTTSALSGWVIVSATMGAVTKTASFTVTSSHTGTTSSTAGKAPGLICRQRQIAAGESAVCEISVDDAGDAHTDGFGITSSSLRVKAPAAVVVSPGRNSIRFEVQADENATQEDVTLEASSGEYSARTSLSVLPARSPYLSVTGPRSARPGTPVRLVASASDAQSLPVSVSVSGLPRSAGFDASTGVLEWTPEESDLGPAAITFTATNTLGISSVRTLTVNVTSGPIVAGLRNGAGRGALAACSPGALMSLTGENLAEASAATRVLINGSDVAVVGASAERVDFVCPNRSPGTPLSLAVEVAGQVSNAVETVMAETAPGLLTLDGSGRGQGIAIHAQGLAAVPRFGVAGRPAVEGEALTLYATGINCDENSSAMKPLLYFGHDYVRVTAAKASAFAGVCELRALAPAGVSGDAVPVLLESVREDGTPVRSNTISVAVER